MLAAGIEWNEGWSRIEAAIRQVIAALEAGAPPYVTAGDYMNTYQLIYDMCIQRWPGDYAGALYDSYQKSIEGYAVSSVLPTLVEKQGEFLLREFVRRWLIHNELVKWLSKFFAYLERFYIVKTRLPTLTVTGQLIFCNVVYEKVRSQVSATILSMILAEREGSLIDGVLLKNVLDIYAGMGTGSMNFYEEDFEKPMLSDTALYYSHKSGSWILACSFSDYVHKANECMRQEEERALRYLQNCSKQRLLEVVYHELFVVHARQLEEKNQSHASEEVINHWLVQRYESLAL